MIRVLAVGDVVGDSGVDHLARVLPGIKVREKIDVVIVNGENAAPGNGITIDAAERIFAAGADVITTGNHVFRQKEIKAYLDRNPFILRPANYGGSGSGAVVLDKLRYQVLVLNLAGTVYMGEAENPFAAVDDLLKDRKTPIVLLDFHAEATSEKIAMGYHLAGRVSAIFGTHTHVQTADEGILDGHTGYITDLGMTGPPDGVIGVEKEIILDRMREGKSDPFRWSNSPGVLHGAVFTIEEKTGKCTDVSRLKWEGETGEV